jgi:hypothetical protein
MKLLVWRNINDGLEASLLGADGVGFDSARASPPVLFHLVNVT